MPSRRRKTVLAWWFGRTRREVKRTARTRRIVDSRTKKDKARKLRDVFAMLKASVSRLDSTQMPGESESLASLIKDISVKSDQLEERNSRKKRLGNRNFGILKRRGAESPILRSFKALPGCLPALMMFGISIVSVVDTGHRTTAHRIRYEEAFDRATAAANPDAVEMILLKRLGLPEPPSTVDRSRYIELLIDTRRFEKANQFVRSIPADGSERSGELQLNAARALEKAGLNVTSRAEYESRLVIAIADPATAARARALLGRSYRQTGQFRACESILEPIRATEQGCLELALLRHSQGQYGDVPTTLAPYLVRWRERWLAPKSQADIETSAEALILMNQESVVLETLDQPAVPVDPEVIDKIRTSAAKALIDREFRSGSLRIWNALEEIERHYERLPCSDVWIDPILKLCAGNSQTRDRAISLRDSIAFEKNCPAPFLNTFARKAIIAGETDFAEKLLESIRARFPEDLDARESLANLLIDKSVDKSRNGAALDKAFELIVSVLRDAPNRSEAVGIRGRIHEAKGQLETSLDDYRVAIDAEPRNVRLHESIARVSRKLGKTDQARIHEQLAKELASTD